MKDARGQAANATAYPADHRLPVLGIDLDGIIEEASAGPPSLSTDSMTTSIPPRGRNPDD
jgi:hypothetical protein